MIRQIFWTLFVRGLLIGAGLISSVITARLLGPEGRGTFFYWSTLAALAIQFGNLGLHSSNTYYLAKGQVRLSTLAANSLWVAIGGGGILGGVLCAFFGVQDRSMAETWPLILPVLVMIPAGLYFLLGTNLLVALGRLGEYNGFELANRYVGLAAISIGAWYWPAPAPLLVATSAAAAGMCLPLYRRLQRLDGTGCASFRQLREGFGYALRAYLAAALGFAVLRANTLFLEKHADGTALGMWSIAAQLVDVIVVVPSTIGLVILPKMMRSEAPFKLMQSQVRMTVVVLCAICILVIAFGQGLVTLLYGAGFAGAYDILLWALPGAVCLGLISIISQYLATTGIPVGLLWIWLAGLIFEAGLSMVLVPMFGGVGAMMSQSMAYGGILCLLWWIAKCNQKIFGERMNAG